VERYLSIEFAVGEEVDEGSFLNEFVFLVNSVILELLFAVSQVLVLNLLYLICPHFTHLFVFISRICVVENGELWTHHVGVMDHCLIVKVTSNQEFLM